MGHRYGFKTEANTLAEDIRGELGLSSMDAFDPYRLAAYLEIPIWEVSSFSQENPAILCLLDGERGLWLRIADAARTGPAEASGGPKDQHLAGAVGAEQFEFPFA